MRKVRAFLFSLGVHLLLLWVAGLMVFSIMKRRDCLDLTLHLEDWRRCFYDEPENSFVRSPEVTAEPPERQLVMLIEGDVTEEGNNTWRGIDEDYISNKNLAGDSWYSDVCPRMKTSALSASHEALATPRISARKRSRA